MNPRSSQDPYQIVHATVAVVFDNDNGSQKQGKTIPQTFVNSADYGIILYLFIHFPISARLPVACLPASRADR
jgi:hypothetical protein